MTLKEAVVAVLLILGVGLELVACIGLIALRDMFSRLHYVALSGFGALAIALAILVEESFSMIGDKALATAFVVLLTGPVLVHATGRAARVRTRGDWQVQPRERVERVEP